MTTFIDFRFSRALSSALFSGEEQEEVKVFFEPACDNYLALGIGSGKDQGILARFVNDEGELAALLLMDEKGIVELKTHQGQILVKAEHVPGKSLLLGIRAGPEISGIKVSGHRTEAHSSIFNTDTSDSPGKLEIQCARGVSILGQGTGRASRWGQLFYDRGKPSGLCVEMTMDWHHLRAGIPLFGTMTAEELIAQGEYRLRFRSYAYEQSEAETTDFLRLFACDDPADIAVHMTPSLYTPRTPGIPNLAFAVVESEQVHPHLVERCNQMDRLCVPSTFTRDAFINSGAKCPIDVVLHGVDTQYFQPVKSKGSLPGGSSFNFLAVGTHVERKNIRHLVHAFLEEFGVDEDVALFLLLRPEYHTTQNNVVLEFTQWEREWDDNSAPVLLWTGYLSREHLRDFYANADVYLMPSNEGFGLTLLEAMSCGTPAIGLNHGGVLDFLDQGNGILVPTGKSYIAEDIDTLPYVGDEFFAPDIGKLREAMRLLFKNGEEVARLGAQARVDAMKLSWRTVSRQFAAVIQRTYEEYHVGQKNPVNRNPPPGSLVLTIVLCVLDDTDAKQTLIRLQNRAHKSTRVLCLFTRYARLKDVHRARKNGFINYRWDGTLENCKSISRAICGQNWITVLKPGEEIVGDTTALIEFLESQQTGVTEVSIDCGTRCMEPRLFHLHPGSRHAGKTDCHQFKIRRFDEK